MAKTKQYSIAKARDQLTQIVHSVERGSKVELTRRGNAWLKGDVFFKGIRVTDWRS
jgi:hypothetical protein